MSIQDLLDQGVKPEDIQITVTPKGWALKREAERRVNAGEAKDYESALGAALRDSVMGRLSLEEDGT